MQNWTSLDDIKFKVLKLWNNGNLLTKNDLFPLKIKLKVPSSSSYGTYFNDISNWVKHLKEHDINSIGYGYKLVEKEVNLRLVGKNTIPTHVIIPDLENAVKLINKQKYMKVFFENKKILLEHWIELEDWINKYPFKIIDTVGEKQHKFIQVIKWFEQNPEHYIYIRQFDIPSVDTKFIEKNKVILGEMLKVVLPENLVNEEEKSFEGRFYIKSKPIMIRFRILDLSQQCKFTDMSVPLEEFQDYNPSYENIFFTENEINFLSFPNVKNSCIIFSKGYGIENFKNVKWLETKKLYYWGDIDTHGFNILSRARNFLPHLESFLMTEDILLKHKDLWVDEEKQFLYEINNLHPDEKQLVHKLQNNIFGKNIRLEQERIGYTYIQNAINVITNV